LEEIVNNPVENKELLEETSQAPVVDWYDDLPPASETRPDNFSSWLSRALVNEINQTLQDVQKIMLVLNEFEKMAAPRQTVSGETIPSPLAENILQILKQNKVDETLREKLDRLQASQFRSNLEETVRQYWETLKTRSQDVSEQLKVIIPQPGSTKIQTEEYQPEDPTPSTNYAYAQPEVSPAEVSPANIPAHELTLDIFDEAGSAEILVVAEHPGLVASSIQVTLNHDILTINAHDFSQESYHKEALLPFAVEPDNFTQQYRNGVLEIRLKKLAQG
jgi:HSP20 family molecular chaperone IbpA